MGDEKIDEVWEKEGQTIKLTTVIRKGNKADKARYRKDTWKLLDNGWVITDGRI